MQYALKWGWIIMNENVCIPFSSGQHPRMPTEINGTQICMSRDRMIFITQTILYWLPDCQPGTVNLLPLASWKSLQSPALHVVAYLPWHVLSICQSSLLWLYSSNCWSGKCIYLYPSCRWISEAAFCGMTRISMFTEHVCVCACTRMQESCHPTL
jgi:hypothetical protein